MAFCILPPSDPGPLKAMIAKQYDEHMRQYGFSWYASTTEEENTFYYWQGVPAGEDEEVEAWAVLQDPFYTWGVDLHDNNLLYVTRFPDRIRVTISESKLKVDYILKLGRNNDPYLKQAHDRPLARECRACLEGAPASDWQPRTANSPPRKCANDKCYIQETYSAEYPIPLYEKPLN